MKFILKAVPLMSLVFSCQQNIDLRESAVVSQIISHNLANSNILRANDENALAIKNMLVFINYPDQKTRCNGTIVGSFKIVTSAHCFFGNKNEDEWSSKILINKNQVTIRFLDKPSYHLKDASTLNTKYIKSIKFDPTMDTEVEHYKKIMAEAKTRNVKYLYWMAYDIAVIELDQELLMKEKSYSEQASITFEHFKSLPKIVEFAPSDFDAEIMQHNENFENVRYLSQSSYSRIIQEDLHPDESIEVRTLPAKRDLKWFSTFYNIYDRAHLETEMHLINHTGQNGFVCNGDSGAPVFLYDKVKKNFLIIGILQGIVMNPSFPKCSSNSYITSLPFHYQWLGISP